MVWKEGERFLSDICIKISRAKRNTVCEWRDALNLPQFLESDYVETEIREMTCSDVEIVINIIGQHLKYDARCAHRYFLEYFADLHRVQCLNEGHFVILEKGKAKILGVSGYTPDKYYTPGIYWLGWTYVDKEFRRRGLGSTLLQYVIDAVQQKKARKLYVDTSNDPIYHPAIALYKSFGFKTEGVLKNYYRKGEDFVILGKELS